MRAVARSRALELRLLSRPSHIPEVLLIEKNYVPIGLNGHYSLFHIGGHSGFYAVHYNTVKQNMQHGFATQSHVLRGLQGNPALPFEVTCFERGSRKHVIYRPKPHTVELPLDFSGLTPDKLKQVLLGMIGLLREVEALGGVYGDPTYPLFTLSEARTPQFNPFGLSAIYAPNVEFFKKTRIPGPNEPLMNPSTLYFINGAKETFTLLTVTKKFNPLVLVKMLSELAQWGEHARFWEGMKQRFKPHVHCFPTIEGNTFTFDTMQEIILSKEPMEQRAQTSSATASSRSSQHRKHKSKSPSRHKQLSSSKKADK